MEALTLAVDPGLEQVQASGLYLGLAAELYIELAELSNFLSPNPFRRGGINDPI
jgi:hypothetical protein